MAQGELEDAVGSALGHLISELDSDHQTLVPHLSNGEWVSFHISKMVVGVVQHRKEQRRREERREEKVFTILDFKSLEGGGKLHSTTLGVFQHL